MTRESIRTIFLIGSVAGFAAGCGDDGKSGGGPLEGSWALQVNQSCVTGITFTGSNVEAVNLCSTQQGQRYGKEINQGTFTYVGTQLTLTKVKTTCPGSPKVLQLQARIEGDKLILTMNNRSLTYVRGTLPSDRPIDTGCWDDDLMTITFGPLVDA